jgi:enhancer of polycomb-like protein
VIDYTADFEDEQFVAEQQHLIRTNPDIFCYYNNNYNYSMKKTMKQQKEASGATNKQRTQIYLTIHLFEQMIDILEKATEFETIIRLDQAEKIFHEKIASCPPPSYTWGGSTTGDSATSSSPPDLMVERVYNYWVQKRCKLKKPLLRKYWPVTSIHDTNPHMVFRPRDKEKYKLRKKRQNDMDAFRKMQLLRKDMERLRSILDLVIRRERLLAKVVDIREEIFQQHMYDCCNTSGYTRTSKLDFQELETLFYGTSSHSLSLENRASLSGVSTSTAWKTTATTVYGRKRDATAMAVGSASEEHTSSTNMTYPNVSITGTTNSLPLLTQPLTTRREHIVTSWKNSVPYVPHYVDGKKSTIQEFNHRGRVGRGGRLCIDRFPVVFSNSSSDSTANSRRRRTHYVGGEGPWLSLPPGSSLIDLMPPTLDVKQTRMKIAEICAQWSEEEEEEEELNNVNSSKPHVELVKVSDWINTDEQPWGEEKLVIGPI